MHWEQSRGPGSPSTELVEPWTGDRRVAAMPAGTLWQGNEQTFKFDLSRLLDMLWARKSIFALTFTTIFVAAMLTFLSFVPQYEATSTVIITPDEPIVDVRSMIAPLSTESQAITSEIQVVKSKPLVEQVIKDIGFREYLAAPPPPNRLESLLEVSFDDTFDTIYGWLAGPLGLEEDASDDLADDKVLRAFYEKLDVLRLTNTSVLTITFSATDPVIAANVANQLAEGYVAGQVDGKRSARAHATEMLTERLQQLRERLAESEQAVDRFRAESGLIKSAGVELLGQQLSEQMTGLVAARARQQTLDARIAELEALWDSGATEALYELVGSDAMQTLRAEVTQLQREIARQSEEYGPRHPVIVELVADLREATSRLDAQVNRSIEAVRSESSMAAAEVDQINQTIAALKSEIADLNAKDYSLRQLEAEAEINRSLHDAVVSRMREAEDVVFERADSRVLNLADAPTVPATSHGGIFLALALVGAFCVSSGVALGLEFLNGGFRNEEELAGTLGLPVLAAVPRLSARGRHAADTYGKSRYGSAYREAFHTLHTRLELRGLVPVGGKAPVVLVTSAMPSEGKSTVTSGLARLATQAGSRVLVIDCDFRRPSLHLHFDIDSRRGLSTSETDLNQEAKPAEITGINAGDLVQVDPATGVHVIPAGASMVNPQRFLRSGLLPRIVVSQRTAYDLILIDTSPVLAVADPMLIGRLCDIVLLVVKWNDTPRRSVQRAIARMAAGDVPVAGCVFNQVALSAHKADSYKYLAHA